VEATSVGKNESRISKSDKLSELAELSDRSKFSTYFNLAGEVEARII
jgi:hypothetical protein